MASLRDIRTRINGVDATRQITRAMQLVATSKMFKAQDAVRRSQAYADAIRRMVGGLSAADPDLVGAHPLMRPADPSGRTALVAFTTNRGLVGALNTNVARVALERARELASAHAESDRALIAIGRVGVRMLGGSLPTHAQFTDFPDQPGADDVRALATLLVDGYANSEFDAVEIVYPRFVNTVSQTPVAERLFPLSELQEGAAGHNLQYIYEPSRSDTLDALLPRFVESRILQIALNAAASEHSARMVAMRNATENANELIDSLTLTYNRQRQGAITSEMIDIASGANAQAS